MPVTTLIRKSASRAYTGILVPFALAEQRLPEGSKVRAGLHSALRTIDSSVGRALRSTPATTGEPPTRDAGAPAAQPDSPDLEAEREAVAQAVRERQPDVGELADPDLDVAEVQAELQAKHTVEARQEAKRARRSAARESGKAGN